MERRDALDARWLGPLAGELLESPETPADPDPVVLRYARRAMATTFEVVLPLGTPAAHEMAELALDEIDRLEQQMSAYRDDSEISQLNRLAADGPVEVEECLFDLLLRCRDWHRESRGAFDVAAGSLVKCWGFYRREGRVPSVDERRAALERSGVRRLRFDEAARTIAFDTPGVEINLGSVGKGYAVDRAVRLLAREGSISQGLVHGGHSSVFAIGCEPGSRDGWQVGLSHPEEPTRRLGLFRLKDRGLGVSAATNQFFEHGGRKLGHILDPRIAWPAEGVLSAAATADAAAEADALATAFYVLGPTAAGEICAKRPDLGAVVLTRDRLHILGRAEREFEKCEAIAPEPSKSR